MYHNYKIIVSNNQKCNLVNKTTKKLTLHEIKYVYSVYK